MEESRLPKFVESQKEKEETKDIAKEDADWHGTIWNNFGWEEEDALWHGMISYNRRIRTYQARRRCEDLT